MDDPLAVYLHDHLAGSKGDGRGPQRAKVTFHVGTSGWHYRHWLGSFYPPGLAASKMLEWYARQFDTVEINNTFYRLPPESVLETWRETVPGGFRFALKGSRF